MNCWSRIHMYRLKVFLVEDSPVIRRNLVSALQELAPVDVVSEVETQTEAFAQLTDPAFQCDLIIVDLVLKNGSGFDVLSNPAAHRGRRRCVVLTNYATTLISKHCYSMGAERVFDKSREIDELIDYCQRLASEQLLAQEFVRK